MRCAPLPDHFLPECLVVRRPQLFELLTVEAVAELELFCWATFEVYRPVLTARWMAVAGLPLSRPQAAGRVPDRTNCRPRLRPDGLSR